MRISDYTLEEQRAWFFRALELAALETTENAAAAAELRNRWLEEARGEGLDGFVKSWRTTGGGATGQETDAA